MFPEQDQDRKQLVLRREKSTCALDNPPETGGEPTLILAQGLFFS